MDPSQTSPGGDPSDTHLAERLRQAILAASSGAAFHSNATESDLLEGILIAAAGVARASAGALLLVDEAAEELVFEVVHRGSGSILGMRIPMGSGIAGYAAVSGQILAVQDVAADPRWAKDIGQSVEYTPRNILCSPMIRNDRVVGVLELLDKEGESSFTGDDIDAVGHFANLAARAIEQSQILSAIESILRATLTARSEADADLVEEVIAETERISASDEFRDVVEIASRLGRVARSGSAARDLSLSIAGALQRFVETLDDGGGWRME